jgi:hypothetical protein
MVLAAVGAARLQRSGGADRDIAAGELIEATDAAEVVDVAAAAIGIEQRRDGQRAAPLSPRFERDETSQRAG